MSNFMFQLLQAINTANTTMQWQQLADAQLTMNATNVENGIYQEANAQLSTAAKAISNFINNTGSYGNNLPLSQVGSSKLGACQAELQSLQTTYQTYSTEAQTYENEADKVVQSGQTQTSQDGTNISNAVQIGNTMWTISSTLASLLQKNF